MIAYIDKLLYQELYAISKIQLIQTNFAKWYNYEVKIDESLLNNIRQFVPIDGGNKSNWKAYRLLKKIEEKLVYLVLKIHYNINILDQQMQNAEMDNQNQ